MTNQSVFVFVASISVKNKQSGGLLAVIIPMFTKVYAECPIHSGKSGACDSYNTWVGMDSEH
jgi:hypothetical protein